MQNQQFSDSDTNISQQLLPFDFEQCSHYLPDDATLNSSNFEQTTLSRNYSFHRYNNTSDNEDQQEQDKRNNKVRLVIKPTLQPADFQINVFTCFQITKDGVIRYFPSIQSVYFGFNQQQIQQVEDFSHLGLVNIKQSRLNQLNRETYQKALQFIQSIPGQHQDLAQQTVQKFGIIMDELNQFLSEQKVQPSQYKLKDEEFQRFQNMCLNFLQQYYKQYPNKMFVYSILRVSQQHKDIDMSNYGYSKSYLELLGINAETLSQIILRNKQIDLIPKKLDITAKTLNFLSKMGMDEANVNISEIVTFDGFPLKLFETNRNNGKMFNDSFFYEGEFEYHFVVTEIDVDLYDLEQLINYRQRLMQNQKLSYDDFLRKELSYLFEDVEYSIHSQSFMEKYYKENLKQMQKKKECGYRLTNS